MEAVTVFLLELIGALVIGHAALYATKPVYSRRAAQAGHAGQPGNEVILEPACKTIGTNGHKLEDHLRELIATQRALAEKVSMAHHRLAEIERATAPRGAGVDEALKKKLDKLDRFRANTEVELTGLKEIMERIESSPDQTKTEKYRQKIEAVDRNLKDLEKDLHKIIYRSKVVNA